MGIFKKKYKSTAGWKCPKCKTENSLNTNVCINCHSINHQIQVENKSNKNDDSFLFNKKEPYNANVGRYKCSECGHIYKAASFCPDCGSKAHTVIKTGTFNEDSGISQVERNKRRYGLVDIWDGFVYESGLTLPPKTKCELWECNSKLVIYQNSIFVLEYSKIINVECMSNVEVSKHYVDNASGAIVGGMLFGTVGAILGGGVKTVVDKDVTYYVIITYRSSDGTKYIVFNVTNCYSDGLSFARKIKTYLNNDNVNETVIL